MSLGSLSQAALHARPQILAHLQATAGLDTASEVRRHAQWLSKRSSDSQTEGRSSSWAHTYPRGGMSAHPICSCSGPTGASVICG